MKQNNTMKNFFAFQLNECDAVKEYLEEMALKGWILKDIKTYFFFEKIEPQKLIYSVEVFDKASMFDTRPETKAKEYIDYCSEAGWEFVCNMGKLNVFVTTDENIVPIETDDELKFKTIKKGMIKQNAIPWFLMPFFMLFNGLMLVSDFQGFITSNVAIFGVSAIILYFIIISTQIISYIIWCKRTRKSLLNGESLKFLNQVDLKKRSRHRLAPLVIMLMLILWISISSFLNGDYFSAIALFLNVPLLILIFGISSFFTKKGLSRTSNIVFPILLGVGASTLLIAVSFLLVFNLKPNERKNNPPLNFADFGIRTEQRIISHQNSSSSVFAKYTKYYDSFDLSSENETAYISYGVFESNYPIIVKQCAKSKAKGKYGNHYKKVNVPAWGAKNIYTPTDGYSDIIVVFENYIFPYKAKENLTDESIHAIVEKLKLK